jgi:hypothetical protein
MGNGGAHDVDVELKDDGAIIYEDALVITYLQIGKVLVRFTPKECDCIGPSNSNGKVISFKNVIVIHNTKRST